mgnify:FL=1
MLSLREDFLKLRLGDSEERGVLTRANARVATAGVAGQQRLLADVVELLELCQHDFVTVPIDGEDLHRTPDDNVGAVAGFAFPEDRVRRRGNWTTWVTSASARSSSAPRWLNNSRRWRNCSRSEQS